MRGQTYQATIIRHTIIRQSGQQSYFTVIEKDICENITMTELSYDEMLGWLARNFCPTMDDGTPCRAAGKPLFLKAP